MRGSFRLVLVAFVGLGVACGEPAELLDGGVATPIPSSFLDRLAEVRCAGASRCARADLEFEQNHTSIAHCERAQRIRLAQYELARVSYDAAAADVCATEAERVACEDDRFLQDALPPACADALRGIVADGGTCAMDLDCASGECGCDRRCEAVAAIGESCAALTCARGSICEGGLCVVDPVRHEGETCTEGFEAFGDCGTSLLCLDGTCHSAEDLRVRGEGETCEWQTEVPSSVADAAWCETGFECDSGACLAPTAEGESCNEHAYCGLGTTTCHGPSSDLRCLAFLSEGQECFYSGRGNPCGPGLICALGDSVCIRANLALGEPCTENEACASGGCDGTCVLPEFTFCP